MQNPNIVFIGMDTHKEQTSVSYLPWGMVKKRVLRANQINQISAGKTASAFSVKISQCNAALRLRSWPLRVLDVLLTDQASTSVLCRCSIAHTEESR